MSPNPDQHADPVRDKKLYDAIVSGLIRAQIWDVTPEDFDEDSLDRMALSIWTEVRHSDGYAEVDICAHLGHDPDLDDPHICGRCEAHIDGVES